MLYQGIPTKMLTGTCRLSYAHLSTPRQAQNGGEPKYGCTLLVPKSDTATKAELDQCIAAAVEKGRTEEWGGVVPPNIKTTLYDGDGVRPSGEPFSVECKGHWVLNTSSNRKPEIVDLAGNPILSATEVYSGMYARVSINFFPYNNSGNRGVGCGLGNVQKLEDGEPLSNFATAASDFSAAPLPVEYTHLAGPARPALW